jgi:hypothetical protein
VESAISPFPSAGRAIEFNAHRVFSVEYLVNVMIGSRYKIDSFSYVDDKGHLVRDALLDEGSVKNSFSLNYGCGIFELAKS